MSTQVFSSEFRDALWNTYDGKCFYCLLPIHFEEMEVDHVIPESIAPSDLPALLKRYGLPVTFNVQSYENLVPACVTCNGRKSNLPFTEGQIAIFLAQVNKKVAGLQKEVKLQEKGRALGYILRSLANSLEKGKFSKADLRKALQENDFLDFVTANSLTPANNGGKAQHIPRIKFTEHALQRLSERSILFNDVENALRTGNLSMAHITVKGRGLYVLRTTRGLRIVYALDDDAINVVTVYRNESRDC